MSSYQDAQECINWYVEKDPTKQPGDRGEMALYPRPGLTAQLTLTGQIRGLHTPGGGQYLYVVAADTLYQVNALFVPKVVAKLNSTVGQVRMVDNGISLYLVDGTSRYSVNLKTLVFATLTDGGFFGADRVDYIDTFFIYNRPGTNQWGASSPLSDVSPALSFSSKDSSSDNLVTLIADHRLVYLVGEKTTEIWSNVGSFPFPFQRIPGTAMQHGIAAKDSLSRLGESIAWLSQDARGQGVVVQVSGYTAKRISTHAVEFDITSGPINDAIAYTYQSRGHEFYVLTLPSQDKTWVYDLATDIWHKEVWRDDANVLHRHRGNCSCIFQGYALVGDWQNGIVYSLAANVYTDNGAAILRMRRTPHMTESLDRVFYSFLQIQFQPGVGLAIGQGSAPVASLRWSDDGGSTWSNSYQLSIGAIGQYKNRAIKRQMGFARDRIFELSISDPINAVVVSAEINTSEGAN